MKPVTPADVLRRSPKSWMIGDRELTKGEIDNIRSDAELINNTQLWKLIILQSKYYAQVRAIEEKDNVPVKEYYKAVSTIESFINDLLK